MSTIHDALMKAKERREDLEANLPEGIREPSGTAPKKRRMAVALMAGGLILLALAGLSWFKGTFTKAGGEAVSGPHAAAEKVAAPPERPAAPPSPGPVRPAPQQSPAPAEPQVQAVPPPPETHDPEAEALYQQALAQQKAGDLAAAEQTYLLCLTKDQSFVKSLNNLGVIQLGQGRNAEARRNFLTAVRNDPEYADAYYNLACLSAREKSLPQALAFLRQALHLDPASRRYARNDPDLAPLSGMKEFQELVGPDSTANESKGSK